MGRPKLPRDEDGNIVRPPPAAIPGGDDTPPRMVNGKGNPLYFAHLLSESNQLARSHIQGGQSLPWNAEGYAKMVVAEAKMLGVDVDEIADHRTELQQLADALDRYAETPEAIWEDADAELEAVLAGMDKADKMVGEYVEERFAKLRDGGPLAGKLKRLRTRIETVLSLRNRARNPLPTRENNFSAHQTKASNLLRFMLYVGRSNIPSRQPGDRIFKIGRHHAKMAWDIYEAEKGIEMTWDDRAMKGGVVEGRIPYEGILIVCPLRHGKSELAAHYTARAICWVPELQAVMLHAVAEEAQKNLQYVASCFDRANEVGRRCMSLFHVELDASTNKRMKVKLGRPLKQATLEAYGFMSGRLGINTSLQVWDDIVPQSDVNEETTRKRRYDRMGGTWKSRQQGTGTFILAICTLWHHDDVNCRIMRRAGSKNHKERMMFRVSRQSCGGPRTRPQYRPLWPEMYDSAWLQRQAAGMSPALYSAAFMSDPRSEEGRIVKELRLYDQGADEHVEFLKRAVRYISLDPSGVNRKGADKAGFVYGGMGEVTVKARDHSGVENWASRNVFRVLAAKQFNATQTDLVQYAVGYAADHKVDYVLSEQQGLSAIADIFRNYHGVDVIPIPAGNKNKEQRLRRVAGMFDEAQARVGGPNAVVEFPGIKEGDRLVLDPEFKEIAEQILDFGVAVNDGLLDAATQVAHYLMPDLKPGVGQVTQVIREQQRYTPEQHKRLEMLRSFDGERVETSAERDWKFSQGWSS